MNDFIIHTYLSGKATEEEKAQLKDWLEQSPQHQAYFFEIKAIHNAQQVVSRIGKNDVENSLAHLNRRIDTLIGSGKRKTTALYLKYAGVAAVFVGLCLFYWYTSTLKGGMISDRDLVTYVNESNDWSVSEVRLSDGTVVWLGNRTLLKTPSNFTGKERRVYVDGEAFFDVKKDAAHPFVVQTALHEVQVLGTSFEVSTDEERGICKTILMTGSVQLQDKSGNKLAVLEPGQQARYLQKTGDVEIENVDVNALTSWRFGLISLSNVTCGEILDCLEKTYQVRIRMDTVSLGNRLYNFSFKRSKGAEAALEQLYYITGKSAKIQRLE